MTTTGDDLRCLDRNGDCAGAVEYRPALSGTGKEFPRCDFHWSERLKVQGRLRRDYGVDSSPGVPLPGFDPTYAGESLDEDY